MLKEKKIKKVKINILPIPKGPFRLNEISEETGCTISSNIENISINNITSIDIAKKGDLSFLENISFFLCFKVLLLNEIKRG